MMKGLIATIFGVIVLVVLGVSAYYLYAGYEKEAVTRKGDGGVRNIAYQGQFADPLPLDARQEMTEPQRGIDMDRPLAREEIGTSVEVEVASYIMDPSIRPPVNFVATGRLGGYAEVAPQEGFSVPTSSGIKVMLKRPADANPAQGPSQNGFTSPPKSLVDYIVGDRESIEQSIPKRPVNVRAN